MGLQRIRRMVELLIVKYNTVFEVTAELLKKLL